MHHAKRLLLTSVAIALVGGPQAFAAPHRPMVLAQAAGQMPAAAAAAQAKVKAARAALEQAKASGTGVAEAQQALDAALQELKDALAAARPPSAPPAGEAKAPPPPKEAPAAEAPQPPAEPPAAEAKTPPPPKEAPAAEAPQPPAEPPAAEAKTPPPPKEAPAQQAQKPKPKKPIDAAKAPPEAKQPPAAAAENPPAQPAAEQAQTPKQPEQPSDQAKAPAPPKQPAAEQAPQQAEGGPPPKFDPALLKKPHPRFGETPKGEETKPLPKEEAQIPKGGKVEASGGRTIVKQDNGQVTVHHDDTDRFRQAGGNVDVQKGPNGTTTTIVNRPGGVQVVTVRDQNGDILQRYRKDRNGQIEVLIGQADARQDRRKPPPPPKAPAPDQGFNLSIKLPPLTLTIPHNQYIVESSNASREQLTQTFEAPPVEKVQRAYSLEEIRRSDRVRNMVRRVDFDTVNFEFGSAVLPDDQIAKMQKVGEAMRAVLDRDPNEVFLIEGHTDAVGSDLANLALSDRRAETVAEILTYYFAVPPENLVTQGYGEEFLKVPTSGPERENRRVVFRNITPLMRTSAR